MSPIRRRAAATRRGCARAVTVGRFPMAHKNDQIGTLEITGEGRIDVKPDVAVVRLGVVTEGSTAEEATAKNAQKMSEVVERLLRLEIPRDDIKTTGLNLYPIYQTEP